MEDVYSAGFLKVTQTRKPTKDHLFRKYDLAISFASWEPRCLELTKSSQVSSDMSIVFQFTPHKEDNDRALNARKILSFFSNYSENYKIIKTAASSKHMAVFKDIEVQLINEIERCGRPIELFLDVSACPKIYSLYIIGMCLGKGWVRSIDVFYAEANHSNAATEKKNQGAGSFQFTDGNWNSVQVPYLEGHYKPSEARHTLIAMGAEAPSVEKFVKRYDPDLIDLYYPFPGADKQIDSNAQQEAEIVANNLNISDDHVTSVGAFDLIELFKNVFDKANASASMNDVTLLCLGTKPHSIGQGLVGIIDPRIQVVCRIPLSYVESKTCANGNAWLYNLRDLSIPPS